MIILPTIYINHVNRIAGRLNMNNLTIKQFMENLSTEAPVPGGGGASALAGSLSAALCSMVASLTNGKKKY